VLNGDRRAPAAPQAPHGSARFGIVSLINRMPGSGDTPVQRPAAAAPTAPAPKAAAADVEDERIEIPAFLRRQAN